MGRVERSVWVKTAVVALVVLCLDLGTKALASNAYGLGEQQEFFFLSILHVQNPGISLGLFSQLGLIDNGVQLPIYAFVLVGVVSGVAIFLRAGDLPFLWLPAGLALGGIGNVVELVYHGYATDFILIPGLEGSANLADFSIVLGLVLFFVVDLGMVVLALAKKHKGIAAVMTAAVLAVGLGACGDEDSTTTASQAGATGTANTGSTGAKGSDTGSTGKGSTGANGSAAESGNKASGGNGSGDSGSASSDSKKVKFKAAPLHVSGGGSDSFVTDGGDNSIQEFGEEASEDELTEAAEVLHSYYVAHAGDDWATACSYMTKAMVQNFENLASRGSDSKEMGCPEALGAFSIQNRSPEARRELTVVDAASLRHDGEQAFLIYHGSEYDTGGAYGVADLYAMPMNQEGGEWKVGALIGTTMGIAKSLER